MRCHPQTVTTWDEEQELWEHQGHRLTVGSLKRTLDDLERRFVSRGPTFVDDLPVTVTLYEGNNRVALMPTEIGLAGTGDAPEDLAITVMPA